MLKDRWSVGSGAGTQGHILLHLLPFGHMASRSRRTARVRPRATESWKIASVYALASGDGRACKIAKRESISSVQHLRDLPIAEPPRGDK